MNKDKGISMDEQQTRLYYAYWNQYKTEICRFCENRLYRAPHQAEDCVQQVFLAMYEAMAQGKRIDNPRAWLYKTAHNQINHMNDRLVTEQKKRSMEELNDLPVAVSFESCLDAALRAEEDLDALRQVVLSKLDEDDRRLIEAAVEEKLPSRTIGERFGLKENTVNQRLKRLRIKVGRLVRDMMENKGIG